MIIILKLRKAKSTAMPTKKADTLWMSALFILRMEFVAKLLLSYN